MTRTRRGEPISFSHATRARCKAFPKQWSRARDTMARWHRSSSARASNGIIGGKGQIGQGDALVAAGADNIQPGEQECAGAHTMQTGAAVFESVAAIKQKNARRRKYSQSDPRDRDGAWRAKLSLGPIEFAFPAGDADAIERAKGGNANTEREWHRRGKMRRNATRSRPRTAFRWRVPGWQRPPNQAKRMIDDQIDHRQ